MPGIASARTSVIMLACKKEESPVLEDRIVTHQKEEQEEQWGESVAEKEKNTSRISPPISHILATSSEGRNYQQDHHKDQLPVIVQNLDGDILQTLSVPINISPDVMIGKQSLILKNATSKLFDQRHDNLCQLIDILVIHKHYRGNVYNLLASFVNIFKSEEPLHTFHSNIFKLKIQEIMFNTILTADEFSSFLNDMKCVFIGRDFRELLQKLHDLFDRLLLKITCKYKVGIELNIVFWMLTHLNLSEHLFILRDLIPGDTQSLTFELLASKQLDAAKTRGGQLKKENRVL